MRGKLKELILVSRKLEGINISEGEIEGIKSVRGKLKELN